MYWQSPRARRRPTGARAFYLDLPPPGRTVRDVRGWFLAPKTQRRCRAPACEQRKPMTDTQRRTAEHAKAKADECRALAKTTADKSHVIMLMQMSGTWDRMAEELAQRPG